MMEVNRLNPTKSIRIGGISHFAFVNGWLLRSWGGRSCIVGNASKARLRSRCPAAAVGPPFPKLTATYLRLQRVSVRGIMEQHGADNCSHRTARGEQSPECTSLKQTRLARGCSDPCLPRGAGRVSVCAGAVRRLPVTSVGTGLSAGAGVAIR